jgi:hypothetical protein
VDERLDGCEMIHKGNHWTWIAREDQYDAPAVKDILKARSRWIALPRVYQTPQLKAASLAGDSQAASRRCGRKCARSRQDSTRRRDIYVFKRNLV